jgi:alanine racemase
MARDAVGLSCASTLVHTDKSKQVNRKNFLNMTSFESVTTGVTLSACGWHRQSYQAKWLRLGLLGYSSKKLLKLRNAPSTFRKLR